MAILPKKAGAIWLGPGEFTHEEDKFRTQREARQLFLAAIQDEAPEVLATLKEQSHLWQSLFSWHGAISWNHFKYADPTREPESVELRTRLTRWAQTCNLDSSADDWIMDRALDTLRAWCVFPDAFKRNGPTWNPRVEGITVGLTDDEQAITFPPYNWNPQ